MTVVASNYERKHQDLYETEPWATEALLRHFPEIKGLRVWEPSAGNHLIADVLRAHGCGVFTSDIDIYARYHHVIFDFFSDEVPLEYFGAIVTNPPYGKGNRDAVKYARLALARCDGWVALLLTAKFDFGKTRKDLFQYNTRFHAKIALLDRIQWFPGDGTGTEDHAWLIWRPINAPVKPPILLYGEKA